jgi:hypothetical protein
MVHKFAIIWVRCSEEKGGAVTWHHLVYLSCGNKQKNAMMA